MDAHSYQVNLRWSSDRKGTICSPEIAEAAPGLNTCIEVATPPEFPKGIAGIWSPEHLFTAAVNSCFMTTFLAIAENSKLEFSNFSCQAKGKLEQLDGTFKMTEVQLEAHLSIAEEAQRERAERILQKSESACLISNSITSKVTLIPIISVA